MQALWATQSSVPGSWVKNVLPTHITLCRGLQFWPEIGNGVKAGAPSLHCPNASAVAAFRAALKSGDIFFHAFAHNGQASTYPDPSLFEARPAQAQTHNPFASRSVASFHS